MGGKYFFGILLILIGAGFLLEQFQIISFGEVFSVYWPSLLILIGISGLFDKKSSKFGNLILIIFGSLIQLNKLNIFDMNVYKLFFPIFLILIGLKIIFFNKAPIIEFKSEFSKERSSKNISLEDTIDAFAMMSGIDTNNQSDQFRGGRATAIMGGIELDLRGAKLYNNSATMEINAIMGGIDVFVPDHWRVEVKGVPILGGWSNKTKFNTDPNAPLLKIECFAMLGGIEIK